MKTAQECNCLRGIEYMQKQHQQHVSQPLTATECQACLFYERGGIGMVIHTCKPTEKCCEKCLYGSATDEPWCGSDACPCHREEAKFNATITPGYETITLVSSPKAEENHIVYQCRNKHDSAPCPECVVVPTLKEIDELNMAHVEDKNFVADLLIAQKLNEVIKTLNELRK